MSSQATTMRPESEAVVRNTVVGPSDKPTATELGVAAPSTLPEVWAHPAPVYVPTAAALEALCRQLDSELLQTLASYAGQELHERDLRGAA